MELANQDQVAAWDPEFGAMAAEMGNRAWGLPELTMREKTFVFIAADLCSGGLVICRSGGHSALSRWPQRSLKSGNDESH